MIILCFIFFMRKDYGTKLPSTFRLIVHWKVSRLKRASETKRNEKLFFSFETKSSESVSFSAAAEKRKNVSSGTRNKSIAVSFGIVGVIMLRCVQEKKKETLFIATISYFSGWMAGWAHHESTIASTKERRSEPG